MRIQLKLFTTLVSYLPPDAKDFTFAMDLPPESRVRDAIACAGIPRDLEVLVFVNGRRDDLDRLLQEGDILALLRPIAGG